MKTIYTSFLTLFYTAISVIAAYPQAKNSLNNLTKKEAEVQKIASGFSFTEGPAVNDKGEIYFTDQPNNKIYIWNEKEGISEFGVDGERANGLYFNQTGDLIACADYRNKLIKIDMDGQKEVLVDNYQGQHLNGPNDLWIHPNGNIYISDSYYHRPWWPEGQKQALDERAVYCYKTNGDFIKVAGGFKMPNGIVGSPDGKTLYIADINAGETWQYTIQQDGTLSDKTFFAPEGSDGMTVDQKGNVYLTNQAISIFSESGKKLGTIEVPEQPANICFGGKKRQTLFITARTSIYKIPMKVKGAN